MPEIHLRCSREKYVNNIGERITKYKQLKEKCEKRKRKEK